MARRHTPPPQPSQLTAEQMRRGVQVLNRRVAELQAFDPLTASEHDISSIDQSVEESIERVFGRGTSDYNRYASALPLDQGPMSVIDPYDSGPRDRRRYVIEGRERAIAAIKQAVKALQERIEDHEPSASPQVQSVGYSDQVFIVHGRDGETKHEAARFLHALGLTPVILDEQANQGMTLIEKFEAHSDVGFAIVLLTSDDEGCLRGEPLRPRARQNVILELGFFVGRLGRGRVAAIVRGSDIELPSDINGLVWVRYEDDWKLRLARELRAAGYSVDMNKVI